MVLIINGEMISYDGDHIQVIHRCDHWNLWLFKLWSKIFVFRQPKFVSKFIRFKRKNSLSKQNWSHVLMGFFFITFKFVNHLSTWKLNIQSVKTPWIWRYHHNNLPISIFCIAKTSNRAISLLLKNFQYTGN